MLFSVMSMFKHRQDMIGFIYQKAGGNKYETEEINSINISICNGMYQFCRMRRFQK